MSQVVVLVICFYLLATRLSICLFAYHSLIVIYIVSPSQLRTFRGLENTDFCMFSSDPYVWFSFRS